jgi:arginyl-tRNA synthetase
VYYIQYAHARVASVLRQAADRGLAPELDAGKANLHELVAAEERKLCKRIGEYPEIVAQAALLRAPHMLVHYLRDLATDFHSYYSAHILLVDSATLRAARLALAVAAQTVLRNGLELLGVHAPETM